MIKNEKNILMIIVVLIILFNYLFYKNTIQQLEKKNKKKLIILKQEEEETTQIKYDINEELKPILDENNFDYYNTPTSDKRVSFPFERKKENKQKYEISIITTIYKHTKRSILLETKKSILNQTFKNFEWILVHDGIKKRKYIKKEKEDFIKLVMLKNNIGLPGARNIGIKNSNGKYLVFLDGDDLIEGNFLETLYWFLESNRNIDLVNTYSIAFKNQNYLHKLKFQNSQIELLKRNLFPVTWMIRRNIMFNFDDTLKEGMEDWDFILNFYSRKYCAHTIEEYHFWYRFHKQDDRWKNFKKKDDFLNNVLKRKNIDLFENQNEYFNQKKCHIIHKLNDDQYLSNYRFNKNRYLNLNNLIPKNEKRILFLSSDLNENEKNIYHLNLLEGLKKLKNYHISIISFNKESNMKSEFLRITSDIYHLNSFLFSRKNQLNFLNYFKISRSIEVVIFDGDLKFLKNNFKNLYQFEKLKWIELIHERKTIENVKNEEINLVNSFIFTSQFLLKMFQKKFKVIEKLNTIHFGLNELKWKNSLNLIKNQNNEKKFSYLISKKDFEIDSKFLKLMQFYNKNENIYFIFLDSNSIMYQKLQKLLPNSNLIVIPKRIDLNFKLKKLLLYLNFSTFFWISKYQSYQWIFRAMSLNNIILGEYIDGIRNEIVNEMKTGILIKYKDKKEDEIVKQFISKIKMLNINDVSTHCRILIEGSFSQFDMIRKFSRIIENLI
eukprot:gene6011-10013_t